MFHPAHRMLAVIFFMVLVSSISYGPAACQNIPETAKTPIKPPKITPGIYYQVGKTNLDYLGELSGMSSSGYRDDIFWSHNDSGDTPRIIATKKDGTVHTVLNLKSAKNIDAEDLDQFSFKGTPMLVFGDIGDNQAQRDSIQVYFISEPKIQAQDPAGEEPYTIEATPHLILTLKYPDGPRDAESLAIDRMHNRLLIFSKRDLLPRLYSVPIPDVNFMIAAQQPVLMTKTLKHIATWTTHTKLADKYGNILDHKWTHQPTAMDLSKDGLTLAILTYSHTYIYQRTKQESWDDALKNKPRVLGNPWMKQEESLTFTNDEKALIITSEDFFPVMEVQIKEENSTEEASD